MTQQQTEITQSQSAIEMYGEQIEKGATEHSDCRRAGKKCDECQAERTECKYYIQYMWFKFGAKYALQLRQEEIDYLVLCLKQLLELNLKSGDDEHDDQHNWSVEEILAILDNCRKLILKYENNKN